MWQHSSPDALCGRIMSVTYWHTSRWGFRLQGFHAHIVPSPSVSPRKCHFATRRNRRSRKLYLLCQKTTENSSLTYFQTDYQDANTTIEVQVEDLSVFVWSSFHKNQQNNTEQEKRESRGIYKSHCNAQQHFVLTRSSNQQASFCSGTLLCLFCFTWGNIVFASISMWRKRKKKNSSQDWCNVQSQDLFCECCLRNRVRSSWPNVGRNLCQECSSGPTQVGISNA